MCNTNIVTVAHNIYLFIFVLLEQVNNMGPLIDAELERVDRKHAQLTQLSSDLVEALNLYHTLMREPQYSTLPKAYAMPPQMNHAHLPSHVSYFIQCKHN